MFQFGMPMYYIETTTEPTLEQREHLVKMMQSIQCLLMIITIQFKESATYNPMPGFMRPHHEYIRCMNFKSN